MLKDNGSEFLKDFQKTLEENGITHYFAYPRRPKMNSHCERFNRTLEEMFIVVYEDLLCSNLNAFNEKLAQWLIKYNTIIPHHSVELLSPIQWLTTEYEMRWTKNKILTLKGFCAYLDVEVCASLLAYGRGKVVIIFLL